MIVTGKVLDLLGACVRTEVVPDRVIGFDVRRVATYEPLALRSRQPPGG